MPKIAAGGIGEQRVRIGEWPRGEVKRGRGQKTDSPVVGGGVAE